MAQNVFPGGLGKKWTQKKCQKHSNFKHVEVEINSNFFYQLTVHDIFYSQILKQVFSKLQDMQLQQHVVFTCTKPDFPLEKQNPLTVKLKLRFRLEAAEAPAKWLRFVGPF